MIKFVLAILISLAPMMSHAHWGNKKSPKVVELQVTGHDQVLKYDFGNVFRHTQGRVEFRISANKGHSVEIRGISSKGLNFNAETNCPAVLPAGKTCKIDVIYWPSERVGSAARQFGSGSLLVKFANSQILVKLSADTL